MEDVAKERARALTASVEEIALLLHHPSTEVLRALLENPALDEPHLCLLLERKNLPSELLEEIAQRRAFLKSYRVKRALAFHPHTPRLASMRLLRDLYLMDLVQLTLQPGIPVESKRLAEEQLLTRLAQLPLGQKITLARRGPARVAAALARGGPPPVVGLVPDKPHMNETQNPRAPSPPRLPPPGVAALRPPR